MTDRIRGRELQRIRARWFKAFPLCVTCKRKGQITIATELDHITPLFKGGKDEDANRQGLCTPCHEAKSIAERGDKKRAKPQAVGLDGFPT